MKLKVFLDTNVFIYAFEYPSSNSAKIIDLLNKAELQAVISDRVIIEIYRYLKKYYNKKLADTFRKYLLETCIVIIKELVADKMIELKNKIKEKDLEQISVVKKLNLKYLISYDRDFENFEEYKTPKEFLIALSTDYEETEF
ncbi:type II toxin-antitoxin system VapC family toxin [archaeon]|nr:type II toxin-antitoxin system VapC family toxin [archaeon]